MHVSTFYHCARVLLVKVLAWLSRRPRLRLAFTTRAISLELLLGLLEGLLLVVWSVGRVSAVAFPYGYVVAIFAEFAVLVRVTRKLIWLCRLLRHSATVLNLSLLLLKWLDARLLRVSRVLSLAFAVCLVLTLDSEFTNLSRIARKLI